MKNNACFPIFWLKITFINSCRKVILACIILLLFCGQNSVYGISDPSIIKKDLEVGIIEHLDSIIPLDLTFSNDKNQPVTLRQLVNKPTIFSFVYFDCPGLCSPLLDGVSQVIENSDMVLGKDYQVITVSFNFHDTPEKAAQKKQTFLRRHSKGHASDWIFLTGDSSSIMTLTNAAGFKFKKAGLDYIHPSAILVVSPKGKITRYLYGISFLPFDVKMAVLEAQKGLSRPTISRILQFCFAYDPAGKRYAMDITKVTGILMLFILLIFIVYLVFKKARKNINSNRNPEVEQIK